MNDTTDRLEALLEHIESQNKAVLEAVGAIQQKIAVLPAMQQDIADLKQDIRVIKAAVVDVSRDLAEHKHMSAHVAHGQA